MYIPPNYPPYFHTYGNFCPCCGRPMEYNPQYYGPWTTYGQVSEVSVGSNEPLQNEHKEKEAKK